VILRNYISWDITDIMYIMHEPRVRGREMPLDVSLTFREGNFG